MFIPGIKRDGRRKMGKNFTRFGSRMMEHYISTTSEAKLFCSSFLYELCPTTTTSHPLHKPVSSQTKKETMWRKRFFKTLLHWRTKLTFGPRLVSKEHNSPKLLHPQEALISPTSFAYYSPFLKMITTQNKKKYFFLIYHTYI